MSTKAYKTTGATGRKDVIMMPPERLTLVTDMKRPLYDPRVRWPVKPELVASIRARGIRTPVWTWKDGETVYVVAGRQRVKAALEINKQGGVDGKPILVPCLAQRAASESDLVDLMNLENEIRQDSDPMTKAENMHRMIELGGQTEDMVALAFGLTTQTVKNHLMLLDCAEPVQKAVRARAIPATLAQTFSKLSREDQKAKLSELQSHGVIKGQAAKRAVRGEAVTPALTRRVKGKGYMEKLRLAMQDKMADQKNPEAWQPWIELLEILLGYKKRPKDSDLAEVMKMAGKRKGT